MSFDELPPDARPPLDHSGEDGASDRETSAADAPPAPSRRRRATQAGTDAASAEPVASDQPPARSTSRRRAPKPSGEQASPAAQDPAQSADQASANTPPANLSSPETAAETPNAPDAAKPKSRRRAAASASPADETPQSPENAPAPEADRPRRQTRRKAAEPENDLPAAPPAAPKTKAAPKRKGGQAKSDGDAPAVSAEAPAATPNAPVPASAAAEAGDAPAKTSRRRSIRKPKEDAEPAADATVDAAAEPVADLVSEPAASEAVTPAAANEDAPPQSITGETLPVSDAADPAFETAEIAAENTVAPSRNRRQRSSRNRRPADAQASEQADAPAVDAPPPAARQNDRNAGRAANRNASKNRSGAPTQAGDVSAPISAESQSPEGTEAEAGTEDASADETGEPRGKRRRNRRNNRSRRETRPEDAVTASGEPTGAAEIVADLTAEAVALPGQADTPAGLSVNASAAAPVVIEEPVRAIDLNVGAHLIARNGVPQIHLNGRSVPPVLFFGNMEGAKNAQRVLSEVRRAANAGVHLHSTLFELPCPLSEAAYVLDDLDASLRALLDADPDGFVMPRIVFVPARGWKREYATEISAYTDGTTGDPSLTSARFWQECERSLEMLIAHVGSQTYGERVFGYHLERGEWFQPLDQGYDRSMANRDAFRDWLREKYQNSLILLRAAWYNGDVQFHTAEIPAPPGKPNPQRAFYETRRERAVIDFNEFTSETTANRLALLARTVKKASASNALVSVCYGYTLEFGHGFSGHLALDRLLASPHIDLITGPPSYRDRKPTGGASFPAPINSMSLHGKLWLSEDDTKTYLAPAVQDPDDFNPRLADRFATEQAQARAIGRALATNTGVGWMDLWGEGWLDDDGLWERIAGFTAGLAIQQEQPAAKTPTPDVIALIDEKSLLHVQKGEAFFRKLTNGMREALQRSGASYGIYLQSDLLDANFPTDARLYLFLTPFRLTAEQRAAIKTKLQRDNKTLAWLYAPGACEERPTGGSGMEEVAAGVVGLTLRPQAWNSEVGSRVLDANHPLVERLGARELGTRERLNPSFYVDDPGATVVAEYIGSGLPSLAARNMGNWKSVFVGDPGLPLELLRGICRYAGVPLYVPTGEDVTTVGNGWVTIHAAKDGQRSLRFAAPQAVYDLQERRVASEDTREYRCFLKAGMTRTFCVGSRARFAALDLPNLALPNRARPVSERDEPKVPPGREIAEETAREAAEEIEASGAAAAFPQGDTALQSRNTQDRNTQDTKPSTTVRARIYDMPFPPRPSSPDADPPSSLPATTAPGTDETEDEIESEAEPFIEPFPEPRRVTAPRPASSPSSEALRADLETLKAVLEMEMPDEEDNAPLPAPTFPPLPLPKEGVPGLEAVLGGDTARRRRRRGGRGRGTRQNGAEENGEGNVQD